MLSVLLDPKEFKALQVLLQDFKADKESKVHRDHKVHKVQLALLDHKEFKEQLE